MPAYDYRCRKCGHEFEISLSLNERAAQTPVHCSDCASTETQHIYRPAGTLSVQPAPASIGCPHSAEGICCGGGSSCGCH